MLGFEDEFCRDGRGLGEDFQSEIAGRILQDDAANVKPSVGGWGIIKGKCEQTTGPNFTKMETNLK